MLAGDLQEHWAKCDYVLLPCPKKSKKKILFTKKDLAKHLENDCPDRDLECEEEGSCTHVHESNCDKKLTIACPNSDCTEVVALQDAKKHLEECDYSEIQCKYQKLGCSTKLPRKDILSHEENDQLHLRMALNSINSTVLNKQESMTFKVTEFTTKKDSNAVFYSPTFYSSQNGYHFQVAVYANGLCDGVGEFVSIYLYLIKGRCDEKLNWPMVANVWFEILNQTQDSDHHRQKMSITVKDNMVVGENMGYSRFIHHSQLDLELVAGFRKTRKKCHKQYQKKYLKDDNSLVFRVSVVDKDWLNCTV